MPTADELAILRALPLEVKIQKSKQRIREWLGREDSYVAFSGGKDSTVLAHLVHQVDPTVPLVFSNTGLEYMEIQSFARKMGAEFIRPEMRFDQVISTYGYPIISKEVAEAIYYARRIRNGAERERETAQTARGSRTLTAARKRTEIIGQRERERENPASLRDRRSVAWQQTGNPTRTNARNRGEWADWRRGCL